MKKILIFCAVIMVATAAQAQHFETQQLYQRMNRLENDLNLMQRQLARGEAVPVEMGGGAMGNAGQISAEIARIDEEMRRLRGQVEQAAYEIDQTNKRIDTLQQDVDYRFQELSGARVSAGEEPAMPEAEEVPLNDGPLPVARQDEGALKIPKDGDPMSARDLYNHAFKLLNQANYRAAEKSFLQFTQNFADDPLIGNAWYWLGEAYYVQRDYVKAADSFRQGFQKLPDGPKAGDNLLKLAMSLSALDQVAEACVVLQQVNKKFAANSEMLRDKARQEIGRLGCK